jgi:Bacterial SH3 domain
MARALAFAFLIAAAAVRPASAQTAATMTAERAVVRVKPDANSALVATVAKDTGLEVLGTEGSWLRVRVKATGIEGYVPAVFVRETGGAVAPETTGSSPDVARQAAPPPPVVPPPVGQPSSRTFLLRGFAGLWSVGGTTGVQAGGGFALAPFSLAALEVSADASFLRVSATNAFSASGAVTYNFVLPSGNFTPFAGAGLTVLHTPGQTIALDLIDTRFVVDVGGGTNVALQLLGGIEVPFNDLRAFRGELRLQFLPGDTSAAILAGISF